LPYALAATTVVPSEVMAGAPRTTPIGALHNSVAAEGPGVNAYSTPLLKPTNTVPVGPMESSPGMLAAGPVCRLQRVVVVPVREGLVQYTTPSEHALITAPSGDKKPTLESHACVPVPSGELRHRRTMVDAV
jgi:hypothetical protein